MSKNFCFSQLIVATVKTIIYSNEIFVNWIYKNYCIFLHFFSFFLNFLQFMNFFLHFMLISLKSIFQCYTFYIIKISNLIKVIAIKVKKVKYKFPENLYTEVRIEYNYRANYYLKKSWNWKSLGYLLDYRGRRVSEFYEKVQWVCRGLRCY